MTLSSAFSGRIIQLTDALDVYDAVSNQVCALDDVLQNMGFDAVIASRFAHPDREFRRVPRDSLRLDAKDLLIVHYYGHAEGLTEWLAEQYCTKVMVYHNITPHHFFAAGTPVYRLCKQGRSQLEELVPQFHAWWGVSAYNMQELIELGAHRDRCGILPILVEPDQPLSNEPTANWGQWAFIGRVAPNKGIVELITLFAKTHHSNPEIAKSLVIVGGFDRADPYYREVTEAIERSDCASAISLTGKIDDAQRRTIALESAVYVSLSEHEGFGVPLIEAAHMNLPVVALDRAAVRETLGGIGVFETVNELVEDISRLARDAEHRAHRIASQQKNAKRFISIAIEAQLSELLRNLIPPRDHFRTLSVVICTYNRRDYLERCLDYLTYQSNDNFEVIVVDGPSDDGTAELLQLWDGRIKVARNPERNLSKSRNIGIDLAAGDIVAFIDDDALPFDDWVAGIFKAYHERPLTVAGLGGPAYYAGSFWFQAEDNGINADCQAKVNIASEEIGKSGWRRYNTGTNATFVRKSLEAVEGFDEQYDYYLDESELCFRLQGSGHLIDYVPDIYVRHEFAQSHNRGGRFNYNWFTICKNTAYFLAAHGDKRGAALRKAVEVRMQEERIAPLDAAVAAGKLDAAERDRHVEAIKKGAAQGLKDAKHWPKTRKIATRPQDFKRFVTRTNRPAVGRDIPPLHVCIVSREAPPFAGSGGVGTLYYHLASELLLMGHHVSFIVPGGETKVHKQGRLTVYFTKPESYSLPPLDGGLGGNVEWSLTALTRLAEVAQERPIDVVDSALWDTEALAFSLIDPADRPPLVVRLVTPYAVSAEHNGWNPSAEQIALFMEAERTVVREANAVIPISETVAATMTGRYGLVRDHRWSVGHCGIAHWPAFDVNEGYGEFPELDGVDVNELAKSKVILFIGRLERRKGIDLILEAAEDILKASPDAFLVIGGRDPENWADRFRERLAGPLTRRFAALGEVSDATREKLLAHAYCVLFPSRYESFGLVPLEAFVHGTPVIGARAGAVPEVVIDGECGLLINPYDSDDLATAVKQLLTDEALYERLSNGASTRIRELSARNSAVHTVNVYQRAISAAKAKREGRAQ
ncbi:MAG: glycosyltransferase [Novosphingobium sp.]|nr:glycosyltransferase [Novosphingobium sp.]